MKNTFTGSAWQVRADAPIPLPALVERMPTVAQRDAHESRSNRFKAITTLDVLENLREVGFDVYQAQRVGARGAHDGYEKHLITLRHRDYLPNLDKSLRRGVHEFMEFGDVIPEIQLRNANDGSSSYELFAAMFRLACCNGLMVGYSFGSIRVAHTGNVVDKVRQGAFDIVESFRPMLEQKASMEVRTLSDGEIVEFTNRAAAINFDTDDMPFRPERLATVRRPADANPSLWNVFNRVQENLIKGGLRGHTMTEEGRMRRTKTRGIGAIDASVKINRKLWDIATDYVDITPKPLPALAYAAA